MIGITYQNNKPQKHGCCRPPWLQSTSQAFWVWKISKWEGEGRQGACSKYKEILVFCMWSPYYMQSSFTWSPTHLTATLLFKSSDQLRQHCRHTLWKYDSWYSRNTRHHKRVSDPNNHSDAATGTLSRPPLQLLTSAPIRCSPTYPPPTAGHLCVSAFIQSSHNPPLSFPPSLPIVCVRESSTAATVFFVCWQHWRQLYFEFTYY